MVDLKKHLKREAGNLKRGSIIIAKKVGTKIADSGKAWWKEQQEIGKAEKEAYHEARLKEARKRGRAKAQKKGSGNIDVDGMIEVLLGSDKKKKE